MQMDDPEATPEMRALQIRFQDAITRVLLAELLEPKPYATLCMINALGHHLVIAVQSLRRSDALTAGAIERILKRLEIHIRAP